MNRTVKRARTAGFTLVEMIVVLVILVAVSALVIPKLGFVQEQAGNAAAAAASAELVSHLETAKISTGSYPLGWDSLLDVTGAAPAVYGSLWSHPIGGGMAFGPLVELEAYQIPAASDPVGIGLATSLGHAFRKAPDVVATSASNPRGEGFYVYDHDPAAQSSATDSAVDRRPFTSWTTQRVARVKTSFAPGTYPYANNQLINAAGYSSGAVPAGVHLFVFGLGPNLGSIGETMASAPRHTEQDQKYYGRFFAIFAVHESGRPASLKAVVDSQGVGVDGNVGDYLSGAPIQR